MTWWPLFLRPMDLGNDVVGWFLRPLVPFMDGKVARDSCDCPLAAHYSKVVQFGDGHGNMMR